MHIQKKAKWTVFCQIQKTLRDREKIRFPLSFTTHDFQNFVPPDGDVSNFNVYAELGSNYPKLKMGVYKTPTACCLVGSSANGIFIHGTSDKWEELRSLIAKVVSSAGILQKTQHIKGFTQQDLFDEWTRAVLALQKP